MEGSFASIEMRIQREENEENSFSRLKFKIGLEPHYIQPKYSQAMTSQPEIVSQSEFNSSLPIPKFHDPSLIESMGPEAQQHKTLKSKKDEMSEEFTEINLHKQIPLEGFFLIINILIWLFYLIGSVDFSNEEISGFHVVDLIGNGFALLLVIFTVYARKQVSSISQILHLWSIFLTITYLSFPLKTSSSPDSDKIFLEIVNILRSLRLAFPLFLKGSSIKLGKDMLCVISKSKKIIVFVLIICFLLGFFCYQTFSDSTGNRCRFKETPIAINVWDPVDERLCGQRQCPSESYCRNPKVFGFISSQSEKLPEKLETGLYSFDSSWHSAVSIFQMFTLNAWGRISQIYFDVYPGWISVPFYIIGWVMFEKLFMALIVIFYDDMKQKRENVNHLTQEANRRIYHNLNSVQENIKADMYDMAVSKVQSLKSIMHEKKLRESGQKNEEQHKMSKKTKILLYCLAIAFSVIHIVLASQFGLQPSKIDDDESNRYIGIVLSIFFILHFIVLLLMKFQILSQGEGDQENITESLSVPPETYQYGMKEQQAIETIFSLQFFIFYAFLADYVLRFFEGSYILEQRSGLTPFAHFILSLRMYYVYLALVDIFGFPSLQSHLITCIKTFKCVFRFLMVIVIFATVLGAISFNINKNNHSQKHKSTAFIFEVNRFLMFLINHSWQSLFNFQISEGFVDNESLFVDIMGGICLIIGSMIFMRYMISQLVHEAFWESFYGQEKCLKKQYIEQAKKSRRVVQNMKESMTTSVVKIYKQVTFKQDNDQQKLLSKQKSFFIFEFQNCFRKLAFTIVKDEYYQEVIRFRFYIVYLIVNVICCIACESSLYGIISTILEGFVLIDILLTSVALRFTGKYSYSQNNLTNIAHFFFCFIVIFVPLFQIMRVFLLLNYFPSFKETFVFVESIYRVLVLHFLILIPILLGYALTMLLVLSSKSSDEAFISKIGQGFKLSLILFCQRGWDISRIFGVGNQSSLFGQSTLFSMLIIWISFSFSLFYSLAGIMISLLLKVKLNSEKQLTKELCNSKSLLEEHKIKQKICKMKPKFNIHIFASGIFLQVCQSSIFQLAKKISCLGSIICFLILNTYLGTNSRISLFTAQLFFFTAEILLFAFESIVYDRNQEHFVRDLILTIFAIPGAYIGFVNPVQYSTGSYEMKVILLLFNALTVVRFIKIVNYFSVLEGIYTFLRQKMTQTFNIFASLLVLTTAIGFYIYLIFQKGEPIIECINYGFIGLIGGDFHFCIENLVERNNISFTYEIDFLYLTVNLLNIVMKNLIVAFVIYELSDLAQERLPSSNTEFNLYNFTKFFHENKFIEEWMKIDPHGKGFVNYRLIMHKSHRFILNFSITDLPYKGYLSRVQTFRKLSVPIYEAETTIEKEESQKPEIRKEFVVTFHDFLFSLAKFAFNEMNSSKLMSKDRYFIKNIVFTDQPVSIINIGGGETPKLSNFSKKGSKDKRIQEIKEQWKKKCYDLTKENMSEKLQNYPETQELNAVLRPTRFNSEQIYFAHKIKRKMYQYLKKVQKTNEMKRFEEVNRFKLKRI